MNIEEVKVLMQLAYKLRASKIRYKDLFVEFGPQAKMVSEPLTESLREDIQPTEDELLYWSTDYEPPIKAESPE